MMWNFKEFEFFSRDHKQTPTAGEARMMFVPFILNRLSHGQAMANVQNVKKKLAAILRDRMHGGLPGRLRDRGVDDKHVRSDFRQDYLPLTLALRSRKVTILCFKSDLTKIFGPIAEPSSSIEIRRRYMSSTVGITP